MVDIPLILTARFEVVAVKGMDVSFWGGLYGSKATDCRVMILLGDRQEDTVLNDAGVVGMDDARVRATEAFRRKRRRRGYAWEETLR